LRRAGTGWGIGVGLVLVPESAGESVLAPALDPGVGCGIVGPGCGTGDGGWGSGKDWVLEQESLAEAGIRTRINNHGN